MNIPIFQSNFSMRVQDAETQIDEVRNKVCGFLESHYLEIKNKGRPIELTINYTQLQNVFICYFNYQAESIVKIEDLHNCYIIEIPLSGVSETIRGKEKIISRKGQAVIVSPGTHFSTQWTEDCTKLLAFINRHTLEQQLSGILGEAVKEPVQFELGLDLRKGNGAAWWRAVQYVIKELGYQGTDSNLNMLAVRHLEQILIESLLLNQTNNYSHRLERCNNAGQPKSLKKLEDYIDSHCTEQITIQQLANVAGVSVPYLFSMFRKWKGITPMNYISNIRYERVHNALKKADDGTLVSDIAMEWGFYQLGRFSKEYKKRYGENPSMTLRNNSIYT